MHCAVLLSRSGGGGIKHGAINSRTFFRKIGECFFKLGRFALQSPDAFTRFGRGASFCLLVRLRWRAGRPLGQHEISIILQSSVELLSKSYIDKTKRAQPQLEQMPA